MTNDLHKLLVRDQIRVISKVIIFHARLHVNGIEAGKRSASSFCSYKNVIKSRENCTKPLDYAVEHYRFGTISDNRLKCSSVHFNAIPSSSADEIQLVGNKFYFST